jgi:hypothetical protein
MMIRVKQVKNTSLPTKITTMPRLKLIFLPVLSRKLEKLSKLLRQRLMKLDSVVESVIMIREISIQELKMLML